MQTICIFPQVIVTGMPMDIIRIIASKRSRRVSMVTPSAGASLQTMPSLPISMVILHMVGIAMGMTMGIIMGMAGIIPAGAIMGIVGIIPAGIIIMGIIPVGVIPGVGPGMPPIGIGTVTFIGMLIGICIAGIMAFTLRETGTSRRPAGVNALCAGLQATHRTCSTLCSKLTDIAPPVTDAELPTTD